MKSRGFDVAGITVPGKAVVRHSIRLLQLADGSVVDLPLLLINGASDGPRLYLGAAIHGDEVNGVEVLSRVLSRLKLEELSGAIVCVPVQNPLAFQVDHRIPLGLYLRSPLDQAPIDPWACFPGDANGNFAETLSHQLFKLITLCDYAIDIHTPTRGGRYVPIGILPHPSLGEAFRRAEALAFAFGSGYIMRTDKGFYVRDGILCVEATRAGVPSFTFELGEGGRLEEQAISVGLRCVKNALRFLKMIPGRVEEPAEVVVMERFVGLRASKAGLLHTEASLGARVRRGDVLARIYSVYGDELEVISASLDGVFVRATTFSTVASGEQVATLGV